MDNCLVFREILKNLELKDILSLRRVNHKSKEYVEQYLLEERSFTILYNETFTKFTKQYSLLRFNYGFHKSIVYRIKKTDSVKYNENFLTKFMPNITELCIIDEEGEEDVKPLKFEILLKNWNIIKIMLSLPFTQNEVSKYLKPLNVLKSLETFVIYNISVHLGRIRLPNESFFARIKNIHVPYSDWLHDIVDSLVKLEHLGVEYYTPNLNQELFSKIKTFLTLDCFCYEGTQDEEFLAYLKELLNVSQTNIVSLKIYQSMIFLVSFKSRNLNNNF